MAGKASAAVYIVHATPLTDTGDIGDLGLGQPQCLMATSRVAMGSRVSPVDMKRRPSGSPAADRRHLDDGILAVDRHAQPLDVVAKGRRVIDDNMELDDVARSVLKAVVKVFQPYVVIMAIYGLVPVGLSRPLRMSLHPLRSTLLYVVAVQSLVVLSCHAVYLTYRELLHTEAETAAGLDKRLLAVLSVCHVSSHFIVVLVWAEVGQLRHRLGNLATFLRRHAHMVPQVQLGRLTRVLPWITVFFSFVGAPFMVAVWCYCILSAEARYTHSLSHVFQIVFVANVLNGFANAGMVLRDLAAHLSGKLATELSCGRVSASRLEEYRLAWLSLRTLTADMGCMPLSGLAMLAYLMVMTTLSTYQAVVTYANGYVVLAASTVAVCGLCQAMLITISDAAHRLGDTMTNSFYEPLEARSWRFLPADVLAEHQQFLHTISCNPAEVNFAGMVTIKRSTYLSIMAAITTYLIVLFQLRQSDEDEPAPPPNSTETKLEAMFGEH